MSDQPQGPGWWRASDGRYYPPQQAPQYGPPQGRPQYGPPQYGPPQYGPPQGPGRPQQYAGPGGPAPVPPPRPGGNAKVLVIVLVVAVLVVGVPVAGAWWFFHQVGSKVTELAGAGGCTLVADGKAGDALGAPIVLHKGSGLGGLVSGVIDSRVLPGAPDCWGTTETGASSGGGALVRVAVKTGDAPAGFQAEERRAKGVTVSSTTGSDGTTTRTETAAYYGRAVSGLGEQAFCTTVGLTGTVGVLVRAGDRLVYASVGADLGVRPGDPSPSVDPSKILDDTAGCERAQKLARAVLG